MSVAIRFGRNFSFISNESPKICEISSMKLQIAVIILILLFSGLTAPAQTSWFVRDTGPNVKKGGVLLDRPWTGGLNAVQYGKTDLDGDGTEDLVIFDRTTSKVSTFIADPVLKKYTYRPEYELVFPAITNWMILVDYDGDGKKELFTYVSQGITAYRRVEKAAGRWEWVRIRPYLITTGLSGNPVNLQVAASDIPALTDFDGDGDMDIITFEAGGDFVELNQNMSMERYGVPDSLEFVRNGDCWGDFRKHTCDDFQFGIQCGVISRSGDNARVMHTGNSILLHDLNGDGKKDMLLGNVDCENLSILYNSAAGLDAKYTAYSSRYPAADPAVMPMFPAAYLEDVDFDGVKDLLVSPNVYGNDNLMMDFIASGWYYHNAGTDHMPDFQLKEKDFLQSGMIDVGENAAVSFFDVDGDGDADMIIGNRGTYDGQNFQGALWLFKNTGTPSEPAYELETDDFLQLKKLGHTDLQPHWHDFDGDGRTDLGIVSVSNRRLLFHYIPNRGSGAAQLNSSAMVEVPLPGELSVSDKICFYDADRDGDMDLLVGGVLGNISYYERTGSASAPTFTLRDGALGGIGQAFSRRFLSLAVSDLDLDGKADVVMTDMTGKIKILHSGEWGKWSKQDSSVVYDPLRDGHSAPYLGTRLHATIADINNDRKPDLVIGTAAGGVSLFLNKLPVTVSGNEPDSELTVYPNPARGGFSVSTTHAGEIEIFDMPGRQVYASPAAAGIPLTIDTSGWGKGIYIVRLKREAGPVVKKVVVY